MKELTGTSARNAVSHAIFMKPDDITNAKEWSAHTLAKDGEGWRPTIGRLANRVEELERENARLRAAIDAFVDQYRGVKAWHDAPLIKQLFDFANAGIEGRDRSDGG
jgi:hypothetical protein